MISAGCDLGILSAKAAILRGEEILALEILPYRSHPREAAREVTGRALARAGLREAEIDCFLSTGFGAKAVARAQGTVPMVTCLQRAAQHFNPAIRTLIDVGGHSFTAFNVDKEGAITETAITDMCAAGTGRFLDVMAGALEMPLPELNRAALASTDPVRITSQCVILAESDVISFLNEGKDRVDIFAGITGLVAENIVGLVKRVSLTDEVAMTGGVAKNRAVVSHLARKLGRELADLDGFDPQGVGALGAALVAREQEAAPRDFRG